MLSQASFFCTWTFLLIFAWLHDPVFSDVPVSNQSFVNGFTLLHQITSPTIAEDGLVYACIGNDVYAYNMDGTVAWSVGLNDTCQLLVSPVINQYGRVFIAVNHRVFHVMYSRELKMISVSDLYNGINLDGSMLGSKPITGLSLMGNGTSIIINAGVAGLYAVDIDGSPLWSTNGDFSSKDATFSPETFCSAGDTICYFHFSPAVDYCDGSIYITHTNGWLYAIDGWKPHVKWRFNVGSSGETSVAGVTAGNNGRVYVATVTGNLYVLDTNTGRLIWNETIGPLTNQSCFPKIDSRGRVILGSLDGFVYVISSDGSRMRRFLNYWAADSVIASCPYIDCIKREMFVAQVNLYMKTMMASDISYISVKGVSLFILDLSTGNVLHSEYYQGEKFSNQDGILDTSLLLAIFASNQSDGKLCNTFGAYRGWKCAAWPNDSLEGVPAYIGGSTRPLYIALPICFLIIGIMILTWFLLRKRYEYRHRQPFARQSPSKNVFPDFQVLYHKRAVYEERVFKLELSLKNNPDSEDIQKQLKKALEDLYTNEWFLSQFSSHIGSSQDREPLLQEGNSSYSNNGNTFTNACGGISQTMATNVFENSASNYAIIEDGRNPLKSSSTLNNSFSSLLSMRKASANPLFRGSRSSGYMGLPKLSSTEDLQQDMFSRGGTSSASPEISPDDQEYGIVWVQDMMTDTDDILFEEYIADEFNSEMLIESTCEDHLYSDELHCYQVDDGVQYSHGHDPESEKIHEKDFKKSIDINMPNSKKYSHSQADRNVLDSRLKYKISEFVDPAASVSYSDANTIGYGHTESKEESDMKRVSQSDIQSIHDKENNSSVEEQENMGIINEEGSIKQSDSSHKLLSTDPGSIRNGARVYSSYVAGMLKGQEAEDKDYCNQKQSIHAQTSANESDRMLSKFPDKDDVEREYDVQVDSNHYDENNRMKGQADNQRHSQIKGRVEAQANSEQRQNIIDERMEAQADNEQQKRVERIKSQTENKQRKSIVNERMKSQTENKQRESLIKERMKVQADNAQRQSLVGDQGLGGDDSTGFRNNSLVDNPRLSSWQTMDQDLAGDDSTTFRNEPIDYNLRLSSRYSAIGADERVTASSSDSTSHIIHARKSITTKDSESQSNSSTDASSNSGSMYYRSSFPEIVQHQQHMVSTSINADDSTYRNSLGSMYHRSDIVHQQDVVTPPRPSRANSIDGDDSKYHASTYYRSSPDIILPREDLVSMSNPSMSSFRDVDDDKDTNLKGSMYISSAAPEIVQFQQDVLSSRSRLSRASFNNADDDNCNNRPGSMYYLSTSPEIVQPQQNVLSISRVSRSSFNPEIPQPQENLALTSRTSRAEFINADDNYSNRLGSMYHSSSSPSDVEFQQDVVSTSMDSRVDTNDSDDTEYRNRLGSMYYTSTVVQPQQDFELTARPSRANFNVADDDKYINRLGSMYDQSASPNIVLAQKDVLSTSRSSPSSFSSEIVQPRQDTASASRPSRAHSINLDDNNYRYRLGSMYYRSASPEAVESQQDVVSSSRLSRVNSTNSDDTKYSNRLGSTYYTSAMAQPQPQPQQDVELRARPSRANFSAADDDEW